jgi:hypothetical protein
VRAQLLVPVILSALTAACAQGATTGAFTQTGRIEAELKRGISTKMDVQRVLGAPKGTGGAVLPLDPRPRELWFYQDVKVTKLRSEGQGVLRGETGLQFLLVFFREGVFDGFMWSSSMPVPVEVK